MKLAHIWALVLNFWLNVIVTVSWPFSHIWPESIKDFPRSMTSVLFRRLCHTFLTIKWKYTVVGLSFFNNFLILASTLTNNLIGLEQFPSWQVVRIFIMFYIRDRYITLRLPQPCISLTGDQNIEIGLSLTSRGTKKNWNRNNIDNVVILIHNPELIRMNIVFQTTSSNVILSYELIATNDYLEYGLIKPLENFAVFWMM